jgi:cysteinyl-tRNA synthetase
MGVYSQNAFERALNDVLRISNTLSGKIEEFNPLQDNLVRMYTCGPTVYDYAHIGNFRTFVFQDVLKRYLRYKGYAVRHVMNITDVDDKTIRNSGPQSPVGCASTRTATPGLSLKIARNSASSGQMSLHMPPITFRTWWN